MLRSQSKYVVSREDETGTKQSEDTISSKCDVVFALELKSKVFKKSKSCKDLPKS